MNNLNQPRTELHKKQNTDNLSKIINRTVDNRRGNMLDMTDGRKRRSADYSGKRTIYPTKGSRRISPREFANSQAKRFIKVATNPGKKYRLPKVNTADKSSLDTLAFSNRKTSPNSRSRMLDMSGGRAAPTSGRMRTIYSKKAKKESRQISPKKFANTKFRKINHRNLKISKKHYKVLKNGTVEKSALEKKKSKGLNNAVRIDKSRLHFKRVDPRRLKKRNFKKLKLNKDFKLKNGKISIKWYSRKINSPFGLTKQVFGKVGKTTGKALDISHSIVSAVGKAGNSDDTSGTGALSQAADYYTYGKQAISAGRKVVNRTASGIRKSAKAITKVVDPRQRRMLKKSVRREVRQFKRSVRNVGKATTKAVKNTAKAAKATAKAATQAAKATAKAVQVVVKATTTAITKIASLIAETAPWSLIIIAALALIIAIILLIESLFTSAGGTLVGGAGWVMGDESKPTPTAKDAYNNYKEYMDDIDNILKNEIIQTLKNSVTGFCADDPTPKKIISYKSKAISSGRLYPAYKQDRTINGYIDRFELKDEDYVEMLSALFVLMTREKQQTENVGENEIFEFIFKTEDISEFIGSVNGNTSRWGDTFFIKTDVNESPVSCPGEDCKIKYKDDNCASYIDDEGHKQYYCKGHPYCPVDHTEKKVSLYKVTDYYNKTVEEIYDFSEAEKTRYNLSKTIISMLIEEYGSEISSEAEGA